MLKRRLLWHLYPSYLLITVLALLAVTLYASSSLKEFYFAQVAEDLQQTAVLIKKQTLSSLRSHNFEEIDGLCKELGPLVSTRITFILPDGRVIADSDEDVEKMENHADRPEFREAIEKGLGRSVRLSDTLRSNMMYLAIPIAAQGRNLAVVRTSVHVTALDQALSNIYGRIVWAGLIVAACAAVVSFLVSRRVSRPIEQMTETAKRFAGGELSLRVPVPDSAELAELAGALNRMAEQLAERIEAISKERSESEAVLSSMTEGVMAVDSDGGVVSINKAAIEFLHVQTRDVHGRSVEEVIRNTEFQEFVQDTLRSDEPTEKDVLTTEDGGRFLRLHGTSLLGGRGGRSGAVIVMTDMTRISRLENIRRDFVANVSHELKTPITSITGFVETLLEGAANEPERAQRFLKIIAKHSDRLNAIVDDLLSLSRLEEEGDRRRLSFENLALKPALSAAIDFCSVKAEEKQIAVELECEDDIKAWINSALLEQAVANLVDNAIKYSKQGSAVFVRVGQNDSDVTIAVQDSGPGIEQKHLSRIFERFYVVDKSRSRKLGGTGLGLAIVKHIAEVHGGHVTVESKIGRGSTFTLHLPAARGPAV